MRAPLHRQLRCRAATRVAGAPRCRFSCARPRRRQQLASEIAPRYLVRHNSSRSPHRYPRASLPASAGVMRGVVATGHVDPEKLFGRREHSDVEASNLVRGHLRPAVRVRDRVSSRDAATSSSPSYPSAERRGECASGVRLRHQWHPRRLDCIWLRRSSFIPRSARRISSLEPDGIFLTRSGDPAGFAVQPCECDLAREVGRPEFGISRPPDSRSRGGCADLKRVRSSGANHRQDLAPKGGNHVAEPCLPSTGIAALGLKVSTEFYDGRSRLCPPSPIFRCSTIRSVTGSDDAGYLCHFLSDGEAMTARASVPCASVTGVVECRSVLHHTGLVIGSGRFFGQACDLTIGTGMQGAARRAPRGHFVNSTGYDHDGP